MLFFICHYGLCAFVKGRHKLAAISEDLLVTCFEFPFMHKETSWNDSCFLEKCVPECKCQYIEVT